MLNVLVLSLVLNYCGAPNLECQRQFKNCTDQKIRDSQFLVNKENTVNKYLMECIEEFETESESFRYAYAN